MKKQIGATIYGKGAEEAARQEKHRLFEANDDRNQLDKAIASPWATWTVEPVDEGWGVFVEEQL